MTDNQIEQKIENLAPHQQRVVVEKQQLDSKLIVLSKFISDSEIFEGLNAEDQYLLRKQCKLMQGYSEVLEEIIALFNKE